MMNKEEIILAAEEIAREVHGKDSSGHDWWHIYRVAGNARRIAQEEGADEFICVLAALLHDIADEKLTGNEKAGLEKVRNWLLAHQVESFTIDSVMEIISTMSFKGGGNPPMSSLEGKVVQDADRLDAIGALGISRVFAYSGAKEQPIHDPNLSPRDAMTPEEYRRAQSTAINHFYEKLLKLKSMMNTDFALMLAEERHRFMERFLEQFFLEWDMER
jgi:uncharacterized protein